MKRKWREHVFFLLFYIQHFCKTINHFLLNTRALHGHGHDFMKIYGQSQQNNLFSWARCIWLKTDQKFIWLKIDEPSSNIWHWSFQLKNPSSKFWDWWFNIKHLSSKVEARSFKNEDSSSKVQVRKIKTRKIWTDGNKSAWTGNWLEMDGFHGQLIS